MPQRGHGLPRLPLLPLLNPELDLSLVLLLVARVLLLWYLDAVVLVVEDEEEGLVEEDVEEEVEVEWLPDMVDEIGYKCVRSVTPLESRLRLWVGCL